MSEKQHNIDDLELLRQLKSLPKNVLPKRDLWPNIEAKLHVQPSRLNRWLSFAVAASLLVSAGLTLFLLKTQQQVNLLQQQVVANQGSDMLQVEQQYQLAKASMLAELAESNAFASESSRAALAKQLDLIDAAITQIKQAMQAEPNNPYLAQMLINTYQQQLSMLEQLTHSSGVESILI